MAHLRHFFRTQPQFVAYKVSELPDAAPWLTRNILGCPLLTWTVRTQEQRDRAGRFADQMIFEGFNPEP
jgi:glycerophosphoryl diester phosphodiesterase